MFTEMRVCNFKSWKDSGPIRLAPVTVFFGTNSSGKTSLLQSLLLMKQTAESPDRRQVLDLGDDRSDMWLGLIGDILHRHELDRQLELGFSWRNAVPVSTTNTGDAGYDLIADSAMSFRTAIRVSGGNQYVQEFAYETDRARILYARKSKQSRKNPEYNLTASVNGDEDYLRRIQGRPWSLPAPMKCYGFPDEVYAYFQNPQFLSLFELELDRHFSESVYYLGPLRRFPAREYRWQGAVPSSVGVDGGRAIETLLASDRLPKIARALKSNGHAKKLYSPRDVVRQWLGELELANSFEISPIADNTDIYRVEIQRSERSAPVLLPDMGFGVSQVLPVLTMLACVPKGSVVILEQPELHLHPAVQSGLADIVLETARVGRAQILIESHSEHLMTRIQRRLAEQLDTNDRVAAYFCAQEDGNSRIEGLGLDEYGRISNWPRNFFGDLMGEASAMVEAGVRRSRPS